MHSDAFFIRYNLVYSIFPRAVPVKVCTCQEDGSCFFYQYPSRKPRITRRSGFLPSRRSAIAVFAMAICPSVTAGIVSKWIKISSNFFLGLVAPPYRFLGEMHMHCAYWLGGWLAVCHSRYCIETTKPILKLFWPSGSPIIEAFGTPYADTKFQGEPVHRGLYIHGGGGGKIWRFSTEMADISETVRDRTMVTMERN